MWLIIFIVALGILYMRDRKMKKDCKVPGPAGLPFFGNGIELSVGKPQDYFSKLNHYCTQFGPRYRVFLGDRLVVVISNPKDVEVVLMNPQFNEKSYEYRYLQPWLGTGLLTGGGEKWKAHRKVITPTFHFKILENFTRVFDDQSNMFVEKLKIHADKGEFNIQNNITLCALDIICESAMGVSVNAQQDSESTYVNAVRDACALINERIRNPLKRFDSLYKFFPDSKTLDKAFETLHGYTNSMIQQRRAALEESNESLLSYTEESDVYGSKKKVAFLDLLLLSSIDGQPLSDVDIREEVDTFLFEGHDTVSSAIGFAVYCLGKNRHVQEKLYQEQLDLFPNNENTPLSFGDLLKMKYMELAIKEALRLYPSVPLIGRMIKEEVMINDMNLQKDTTLLIHCFKMNRNPVIFPDPEKFIPERFLPEETNKRNPFSSVFFSAGPRNCIGQKFAILEMKATLAKLVRNFIIESSTEPLVLTADIVLKSVHGISVKLTSRK